MADPHIDESIDLDENQLLRQSRDLLKILLKDRTTQRNIIWATNTYEKMGKGFRASDSITIKHVTGSQSKLIRPRIEKLKYEQKDRTKIKAEVFTPTWIVKMQNDLVDRDFCNLPLEEYVSKTWLEITCGEAPYMVSRYDTVTGKALSIDERVGFIDRKLKRISDQIDDPSEWIRLTKQAYKSSFGYEFQGDSVLIARENLLYTFIDYYEEKFQHSPDLSLKKELAIIISYNLFQMDGLKYIVPLSEKHSKTEQLDLFSEFEEFRVTNKELTGISTKIKDWETKKMIKFNRLRGGTLMKFDVVIGNPPYQEEAKGGSSSDDPIYHVFMDESYNISDQVMFITPARFLFNAGKTPKVWNKKMLNDKHFKVEFYEQKSEQVFPNTDIKGGIAITYRNANEDFGELGVFTAFAELNSILEKVEQKTTSTLDSVITGRGVYRLTNIALEELPEIVDIQSKGHRSDVGSGAFKILSGVVFFDEKPISDQEYVKVLGIQDSKRVYKWINRKYLSEPNNFLNYKVILPKANGSGTLGEALSTPLIGYPLVGYTETFIGIGNFETEEEASFCLKYIKSKFARAMLGILKITQDNPRDKWSKVPIQDFTSNSDIDWLQSIPEIDQQLYKKYGLNQEEINFIETKVKEMK